MKRLLLITILNSLLISLYAVGLMPELFNSEESSDDTSQFVLTLTSPVSGDHFTDNTIVLNFEVENVPLNGKYALEIYWEVPPIPNINGEIECGTPNYQGSLTEIVISENKFSVPIRIDHSLDICKLYAHITSNDDALPVYASIEPITFSVTLLKMEETDVWITPVSKTASENPLEITIHVNEDLVKDKEYEIFYDLRINEGPNETYPYEGSIKLEESAYYYLWYHVRIKGYEEYIGFASYTVKDLSNPILKLISPEADSEFLTSEVVFNFEVDNIPLDGSYIIDFWVKPLWAHINMDFRPSMAEQIYSLPIHNSKIYYQLTTKERWNEYKVGAALRKNDHTTAYVSWIDEFTFKWGLSLLSDKDITILPKPGSVLSNGEPITIQIKDHIPNADKAIIEYIIYSKGSSSRTYNYSEEGIVLSKKGEYNILFHITIPDYYFYEYYSAPYEVPRDVDNINEMKVQGLYTQDGIIYIPTKEQDQLEIYNLQGIKLHSQIANEEMTGIEGMPKNQILIIKTQNGVAKCIIKE